MINGDKYDRKNNKLVIKNKECYQWVVNLTVKSKKPSQKR